MAYDEGLAERIREVLQDERGITEKKMFGGIGFLAGDHMVCGVLGDELIVRVGPGAHAKDLKAPHTRPFDFTGRPMAGWLMVAAGGHESDEGLTRWVEKGLAHARSLPPKGEKPPAKKPARPRKSTS